MKAVQDALSTLGIAVFPDVWRPLHEERKTPNQYIVYVTDSVESGFEDDLPTELTTYIYMNLWSAIPPTAKATELKQLMWAAGFEMKEETTGSNYSSTRYEENLQYYCISYTWVLREEYTRSTPTPPNNDT